MSHPETNLSAPPPPLPHDAAYKSIFAHTLAVEHLIRGFVANLLEEGPAWNETLDYNPLKPVPTENTNRPRSGLAGRDSLLLRTYPYGYHDR